MRWIAASLLAANVLLLITHLLLPGNRAPSAPATPPPVAITGKPSLVLLRELDETTRQTMVSHKERLRRAARETSGNPLLCSLVGPFPELLKAEYFTERLAALEVASSIQTLEVPGEASYWVYLPPGDSRKQAFNRLRELQAKGIDSYVIPKGELANGISFGMFSQADLANSRLKDMRSRGYPAELKEISRSYKEIWVVVEPDQAERLDAESWLRVMGDGEGLERRQNFCPAVASE